MSAQHEACPDCKVIPKGAFKYLDRWFVRCANLGCHNVTSPTVKGEPVLTPEAAWAIWDTWARRERLREERDQRDRDRAAEACTEDAAPAMEEPAPPMEDAATSPEVETGGRRACRLCGRVIDFERGPDGHWKPFDVLADGTRGPSHFLTCQPYRARLSEREAEERRRREAEAEREQGRLF